MDDSCAVCAETLEWTAYGQCGHREVCSTCVARLRFICNDQNCCICKSNLNFIFVTKALGEYTSVLSDFSVFLSEPKEGKVGSYWYHEGTHAFFDDIDHYKAVKAMSEADKVNEIVHEILLEIKPTGLDVPRHSVGLKSRVDNITAMLSSAPKGVVKIGIYGLGGVGKTTLAKAVFNDQLLLGSFKGSCFLANVREILGTLKGLESLQQQLINDVLKSKNKVEVGVGQGTKLIKAHICSTKILVVVDDLDDHTQFTSLVGPFASGSVVIVTTRDEETLNSIEVETKYRYRVNELGVAESETLFFKHAFGDTKPNNTLMMLSKDILRLAGGLPLALQVFGSDLHKKPEVRWKYYIEKLQRNPNSTIQQRLMISLNAMELDDPLLKDMFLDIACFFIGREKEEVVEILDTYYSYVDTGIDILMKKCLLTINDDNKFRMHDLLQDVGKQIARNNSPDEPGKYSRLWVPEDVCNVLEERKGTEVIEGIVLHSHPFKDVSFAMETFRRMSKLRFLSLDDINLTGKFQRTLEDLRWFCWKWCPLKCLPSDFCPQKIVILELPHSKMTTMWEVNEVPNAFEELKTLNMSFSGALTATPDFRRLPCLRKLNFDGCTSLKEVHNSIGSLVSLVSLNLKDCKNLRSLPDTICNLKALEFLSIDRCTKVEALPKQLGKIKSLKELNAASLAVSKLPDSIGNLSKLVKLDLDHNPELECLPDTICNLRALEVLSIRYCTKMKELPEELGKIESLKELDAAWLAVSMLPDSIGNLSKLVKLDLGHNEELQCLPDTICNLRALEVLSVSYCTKMKELPEKLGKIESLKELHANGLAVLKLPDSIGNLCKLVKLHLGHNEELQCLPDTICNLRALEVLSVSYCTKMKELPEKLGKIESLKELHANGLAVLKLPDSIGYLSKLVKLSLNSNKKLKTLPDTICNLRALEYLYISNCTELEALPVELGNIESLRMLEANNITISKLPDSICNMRALEILDIHECDKLERLPDQLWKLTRLLQLNVSGPALLKKLPDIESSQTSLSLTYLDLSGSNITALPSGISLLLNLEKLQLSGCGQLLSIAELPPNLLYINADCCTSLERLNLSDLKHLKILILRECTSLVILNLSNSKHLEILSLRHCTSLTEISGLGELTSLEEIYLEYCNSSLLARTLTKTLFQIYSSFEQKIRVDLESHEFPDWIIQSSVQSVRTSDRSSESTVDLQPYLSHNYLGMILCFQMGFGYGRDYSVMTYSVMTSASNKILSGYQKFFGSGIVIVPRSIFTVTDADLTIKFTSNAIRHWIRLLYKNEDDSMMGMSGGSSVGQMSGMPMGHMGQMGNMQAAVQGLPAAAVNGGAPGGYFLGAGGPQAMAGNPYYQQQMAAAMMNQQRANGEGFHPMMNARPPPAVNYYMPPHPYYPYQQPPLEPFFNYFSDDNTSGCNVM